MPPKRPLAIADSVIELANDPARRLKMGEAGKAFVFETFDPQLLSQKVEAVYQKVVGNLPAERRRAA